jgi:RNA polymerase sigma-70 factor (ECF subfamily)
MSKFADIQVDPAIVKRAARGDARAHEIIYRAFAAPVYSLCLRFTKVPAQAEDLVQETFIEIMRSIAKFRGEAALGSWIRRIAVSKALMYLQPDVALDLDSALASLPSTSRAVVWLHDVEGFTHKEIAALMGRTESFSKSQLSRAYQRLRPLLAVPDGDVRADSAALRGC